MTALGLVLGVSIAIGALVWHVSRPRIVVRVRAGAARVARGRLGPVPLGELDDIARAAPEAAGSVEVRGRRDTLSLRFEGLEPGIEQRIRNTLLLNRDRL